jgi:hypothetical protein
MSRRASSGYVTGVVRPSEKAQMKFFRYARHARVASLLGIAAALFVAAGGDRKSH